MQNFEKLLKSCKTDNKKCMFQSLIGGKYIVPPELMPQFLQLYVKASSEFDGKKMCALTWRPPQYHFKPLHFDIDIHLAQDTHIPNEAFIEFAEGLCFWTTTVTKSKGFGIILSRKAQNVKAKNKDGKQSTSRDSMLMCWVFWFLRKLRLKSEDMCSAKSENSEKSTTLQTKSKIS